MREFLVFLGVTILSGTFGTQQGGNVVTNASVKVKLDQVIGRIDPNVYGHFIEHLGGVIYDGVWVGEDSDVPNINGIRKELVDHMKRINPPIIRWPGGCFADRYHWADGIGPRQNRPKRYGRWNDATESNAFGTHEFIEFCRLIGAEPYIVGNVGTGTAEEFQQWIEYCNAPADSTSLAELREKNGSRGPFNVKFWGVGNESWGCGGNFTPEDYCAEYRKFTTWLPTYGKELRLIACGPSGNDTEWTRRFFAKYSDYSPAPIHGWAPHYYCGTAGSALEFNENQWYELLARAAEMEKLIEDQWAALAERDPAHRIKLVIDEWGCWHPPGTEINKAHLFEQMSTLRDAQVAAITLDIFNKHCDKVAVACIAQLINNLHSLFLADGPKFVATPNFYVYEMYKSHQGANGVNIEICSPQNHYKVGQETRAFPSLLGSASINESKLHISLVNTSVKQPILVTFEIVKGAARNGKVTILTHEDIHAHNTFDKPSEVVPQSYTFAAKGSSFTYKLPAASIAMFELEMEHNKSL